MTIKNSWKRVIAGTLAVLCVAAYAPAELGSTGLFGGAAITAYAAGEDITSNITIRVSDACEDYDYTVYSYYKGEYTVKEGVVVTFECSKWWTEAVTIYLNGTAVATWSGPDYNSKYVWTAKKDAKINWAGYKQESANIYLTETSTVAVTGITLDPATATLTVGGTQTLTATVLPDNATDKTVTWSSSNTDVATVDANGKVTAVAAGTATITATATNGTADDTTDDKTATCEVTVKADKTALNDAITAAETLYNSIKDNNDYTDIASTLKTAIDNAKAVANSDEADQDAVDAAKGAITTAKQTAETAKKNVDDTKAANAVIDKINALPASTDISTSDKTDIEAARAAYNALTADQKTKVSPEILQKLQDAEAAAEKDEADQAAAGTVTSTINDLPAAEDVTTADKTDIEAARKAYNDLTADQKAKVTPQTLQKLQDAEAALAAAEKDAADQAAADTVTSTINDLPAADDVTTADKTDIEAARKAYNDLTADQKAKVTPETLQKLQDAEAALAAAEKDVADQAAADAVAEKISALPTPDKVTTKDKDAIKAARKAYDDLTEDQKAKVSDSDKKKLEDAEKALAAAEKEAADQAAADAVAEKISALPAPDKVTTEDKDAIEAARKAYDDLTEDQKAKVSDSDKKKLEDAEKALAAAEKEVARIDISKAKVKVNNKTYTGKALKPGSKVIVNGKRLKKGRDYTVTYKNNKKVGVATAVIKGIGNYKGTVKTTFKVKPMKVSVKSISSPKAKKLKVTWKKTPQATGYQIKVSTNKNKFKGKALVKNVFAKRNGFVSKTFSGMKSGKTYYVKIRAYKQTKSGKIYGQYSAVKKIKVK